MIDDDVEFWSNTACIPLTQLLEAVNTAIKTSKLELNPRVDGNALTGIYV